MLEGFDVRASAQDGAKIELLARISCLILVSAAIAVAKPQVVAAQDAADTSSIGVENIVVTSRRRAEQLQSQPLSVAALSSAALEKMNVRQLTEIQNIPNVSFTAQPGFMNTYTPSIRGISQSDPILSVDQPIALYVDGVLYARAIFALQDLIEPERIEVLRGPQGSLFGRNTTGGAVNIYLPKPKDAFGASIRIGYATNDEITLRGIIDTGLLGSSGLKAKLALQRHQRDGYIRNLRTNDRQFWPGADETDSAYFNLDGDLGTVGTFSYKFDYTHSLQYVYSGQLTNVTPAVQSYFGNSANLGGDPFLVQPNPASSLNIYPDGPRYKGHAMGNALTLDFPINDQVDIKSITAIRSFKTVVQPNTPAQGLLLGQVLDPATGTISVQPVSLNRGVPGLITPNSGATYAWQRQISQELQVSGQLDRHKYVGGVYFFTENVHEKARSTITLIGFSPAVPLTVGLNRAGGFEYKAKAESYAIYLSDTYLPPILDDKFEISGGLRYTIDRRWIDRLNTVPGVTLATGSQYARYSAVSGDLTLKYQWTSDFMSYARFANAYASGGFSGRDVVGSPSFAPEYANNFEMGVKSEWFERRLRFNADIFYTKYNDKQITTFAPGLNSGGLNSSRVANAGTTEYLGSEIEITMKPTDRWDVDMSWGHTWPKYKQFLYQPVAGGPIFNIAGAARFPYFSKTSFSIGSGYNFGETLLGEVSVRIDFSYKSGIYFHPSNQFNPLNEAIRSGSQNLLSASIDFAHIPIGLGRSEINVSFYGKNLLDKRFKTQATDFEIIPPVYAYATSTFARPRVLGINLTAKY